MKHYFSFIILCLAISNSIMPMSGSKRRLASLFLLKNYLSNKRLPTIYNIPPKYNRNYRHGFNIHHPDFIKDKAKDAAHEIAFYLQIQEKLNEKLFDNDELLKRLCEISHSNTADSEELIEYKEKISGYANIKLSKFFDTKFASMINIRKQLERNLQALKTKRGPFKYSSFEQLSKWFNCLKIGIKNLNAQMDLLYAAIEVLYLPSLIYKDQDKTTFEKEFEKQSEELIEKKEQDKINFVRYFNLRGTPIALKKLDSITICQRKFLNNYPSLALLECSTCGKKEIEAKECKCDPKTLWND